MVRVKRDEEADFWRDEEEKYTDVYDEITRQKRESKCVEEALFQVVCPKQVHIQFSDDGAIRRKQTIKKLFGLFKKKNKEK